MTDINISSITGLPELPEGQYWKVCKSEPFWLGSDETYSLGIFENVERNRTTDWSKEVPTGTEVESRKQSSRGFLGIKKTWTEHRVHYVKVEPRCVYGRSFDGYLPTKFDVSDLAYEIMADLADRAHTESLLGCYPPNKLEVN